VPLSESDTRAKLIDPALHARGWTEDLIRREETAGAIELVDGKARRQARGRVDYTLRIKVNASAQPVAVALIESILRGSYSRVIRDITVGLAALTLLLLMVEYFRVILIGGLVIGVLVLTLQNLREALAPVRKRKRRKKLAPEDPSKG